MTSLTKSKLKGPKRLEEWVFIPLAQNLSRKLCNGKKQNYITFIWLMESPIMISFVVNPIIFFYNFWSLAFYLPVEPFWSIFCNSTLEKNLLLSLSLSLSLCKRMKCPEKYFRAFWAKFELCTLRGGSCLQLHFWQKLTFPLEEYIVLTEQVYSRTQAR